MANERKRPVVYLDVVDVIQMVDAALESQKREADGILRGTIRMRAGYPVYRIYFVEALQAGRRTRLWTNYSLERFSQIRERHAIKVIGSFHSHIGEDEAFRRPSMSDLRSISYDPREIGAIVWVRRKSDGVSEFGKAKIVIEQRPMFLKCSIGGFETEIHFFALRRGAHAIRGNRKVSSQYRRVVPRCLPSPKIRGEGVVLRKGGR